VIASAWQERDGVRTYTLDRPRVVRLWCQIVAALAHAHRLGIVHRDLKPENVLLVEDDENGEQAKVVDFGIAKILEQTGKMGDSLRTDSHADLGTALYMAPERFDGAPGDPRMDVYALGLLLHELLSGLLPFAKRYEDREDGTTLLHRRFTEVVPPLALEQPISPALQSLLSQLLERDATKRPASARIVRDQLRELPEVQAISSLLPERSGLTAIPGADLQGSDTQSTSTSTAALSFRTKWMFLPLLLALAGLSLLLLWRLVLR
jgi:serine/threonine protein kinase